MQQYLQFLADEWLWVCAFIVVVILLIANELHAARKGAKKCSPVKATQLINQEKAQVVDVRDKAEFKSGHITGAINMPIDTLANQNLALDHDKPIIVVCKLGQRAQKAALLLKGQGYPNVHVLTGGLTAWRNDGLPLVKK